VCEISSGAQRTGAVYAVKVIGALAMVDDGEMDWKLLAVRADDPLAQLAHDVADPNAPDAVKKAMDDIREWFRTYKTFEGKGLNEFAFDGKWLDAAAARGIVASTHAQWRAIVDRRTGVQEKKAPWLPAPGAAWAPGDAPADGAALPSREPSALPPPPTPPAAPSTGRSTEDAPDACM
jgi:hypothetical protein